MRILKFTTKSLIRCNFINYFFSVPTKPPSNVSCRATSASVISCSWRDVPNEYKNGMITNFIIKYRTYSSDLFASRSDPWMNVTAPSTSESMDVRNLKFFTRYELQIHAVTSKGEGVGYWLNVITNADGMLFTFLFTLSSDTYPVWTGVGVHGVG